MKFSRVGTVLFLLMTAIFAANCGYYNQVMARKNLVDGAKAYKDRKFDKAEELFRSAVGRDPEGETLEGRTAQLFLARTIHSKYIGARSNKGLAESAIEEYKKVLARDITDNSSFKAIANLLENLNRSDEARKWIIDRTNNEAVPPDQRAEALTSLASKANTCANEITESDEVKKTVTRAGIAEFEFVKPDEETYEELIKCVDEGTKFVERAVELEPDRIKKPGTIDAKSMEDDDLRSLASLVRKFQSTWSYRASLFVQRMRIADMNNSSEDEEKFKEQAEEARDRFEALNQLEKKIETELEARAAAEKAKLTGKNPEEAEEGSEEKEETESDGSE